MTAYKRGEVVLVPFPFTDFSTFKQRPALVISSNKFNAIRQDVIVAAISSYVPKIISAADFLLSKDDLMSGGLPKQSIVKIGKIVTIDHRLIRKAIGLLPPSTIEAIFSKLHSIL